MICRLYSFLTNEYQGALVNDTIQLPEFIEPYATIHLPSYTIHRAGDAPFATVVDPLGIKSLNQF